MAFKFGILILVVSYVALTSALPPCVCGRNLLQVCGSDGVTYANQCQLLCAQSSNKDITLAHEGRCEKIQTIAFCTFEYAPVCGTDGETYPNKCVLDTKKATKQNLEIKHEGACEKVNVVDNSSPASECKPCTLLLKPVCGTDGNTYPNDCVLNCEKTKKTNLEIKHQGECEKVKVVDVASTEPICFCTFEYNPVCGTNGRTYGNKCALECEKATKQNLEVKHLGECEAIKVEEPTPITGHSPCICTRELKPVCGTDNVTYSNMCLLNCAASKSATKIELKDRKPCEA